LAFLQQEEIVEKNAQNVYCFDEVSKGMEKVTKEDSIKFELECIKL